MSDDSSPAPFAAHVQSAHARRAAGQPCAVAVSVCSAQPCSSRLIVESVDLGVAVRRVGQTLLLPAARKSDALFSFAAERQVDVATAAPRRPRTARPVRLLWPHPPRGDVVPRGARSSSSRPSGEWRRSMRATRYRTIACGSRSFAVATADAAAMNPWAAAGRRTSARSAATCSRAAPSAIA